MDKDEQLGLEYIKNQTLIGDVKIVCNTICLVMKKFSIVNSNLK